MTNRPAHLYSVATILILTFFAAQTIGAQTLAESHEHIRQSIDKGETDAAVSNLKALRASQPNVFGLNNYDYLLARLSEQRGETAQAAMNYQTVAARGLTLRQYGLWHLAYIARTTGNLTLERDQLRQLVYLAPTILLREAAKARLAESFFESGDYTSAIQTLRPVINAKTNSAAANREALALIGRAYQLAGQRKAAREIFNDLTQQLPDAARPDDYALAGARGLDSLDAEEAQQTPEDAPLVSENEHLRRANIYNFNRDFDAARRHFLAIIDNNSQTQIAVTFDALYQIGRGFYQQRRFDEAIQWFDKVLAKSSGSDSGSNSNAREALGFKASALARLKQTDQAIAVYEEFINRFPAAPNPERAYLNIIDALRDAERDTEALTWVDKTRARFNGQNAAAEALFEQARIHLGQRNWAAALTDFEALRSAGNFDGQNNAASSETTQTEISLMRGYTLEQLNRTDEAIDVYLSLPDGRNQYYGGRATRRLRNLARNAQTREAAAKKAHALLTEAKQAITSGQIEQARSAAQSAWRFALDDESTGEALEIVRKAYALLPAYSNVPTARIERFEGRTVRTNEIRESNSNPTHKELADELLFLCLYDEAAPEAALAENSSAGAQTQRLDDVALATLFLRGDMATRAIRLAEPLWKKVPSDYLLELAPLDSIEMLYPAPYKQTLLASALPRKLDSRFVLAIARQESRFQPGAKSVAAARGLLQFISSTSESIATQLDVRDFRQDELYDPSTTLLFGAEYMKNLFGQFPDMPEAVAASYNGGEDNVARWTARARSNDPDAYVAEIGFTQSKDYVTKVLPNFWAYQTLYTEQLQAR